MDYYASVWGDTGRTRKEDVTKSRPYGIVVEDEKKKVFAAVPLGNDQFAAVLFFERHRLVECGDGALRHFIGRRLRGDAL